MTERFVPIGYVEHDIDRWVKERDKKSDRTEFERDKARVLHSSGLRRLGAKTQVLSPSSDDFIRTRLTHSLEVAQIGREIAKAVGANADVVETAALSHDLGHPPFGHNGEEALNTLAQDIGGFEGNAQTLRILTRLEPKVAHAGLNLTRASLDASCKYPWTRDQARDSGSNVSPKFGVYKDDAAVFNWFRTLADGHKAPEKTCSMEAQIMDVSDDISYSVHDVEDAIQVSSVQLGDLKDLSIRQKVLEDTQQWYLKDVSLKTLDDSLARLEEMSAWVSYSDGSRNSMVAIKNMTSDVIGHFVQRIIDKTQAEYGHQPLTRYNGRLVIPEDVLYEFSVLKGVATSFIMVADEKQPEYKRQQEVLDYLVSALYKTGERYLDPMFAYDFEQATTDSEQLRVIIDQVASLTDTSAMQLYNALKTLKIY